MLDTFPAEDVRKWMANHTTHVWLIAACYLGFVLTAPGKIVKKHGLLPQWYYYNGLLQLCLLVAFLPTLLFSLLIGGWRDSVCRNHSLYTGVVSGTVMFLFVFTKLLDLAETVLIVLEGRHPLLIHIFHHVVTLLFTWNSYSHHSSLGRWFVAVNLFSHVILYSYLSPKKFGIAPCWLFVAFTQVYQLVFCLILCFTAQSEIDEGRKCDVDPGRLSLDKFVSAVFFFIFADFYHVKYRKFRETHDCALAQYLRSSSTRSIRRTTPRRSPQKVSIRQWSPTGITPTDPYVTN
ncbi:GNS1/SUR4 family protein [Ostertagia ostertagi]